MTIDDYRTQATIDAGLLASSGNARTGAGCGHLGYSMAPISARYHEALAAIRWYDAHGELPRWART